MNRLFISLSLVLLSIINPTTSLAQNCQCVTTGETLWRARVFFHSECSSFGRADCNPIQGRWYCSSQEILNGQIPIDSCSNSSEEITSSTPDTLAPTDRANNSSESSRISVPGQALDLTGAYKEDGHAFILTINAGEQGDSIDNHRASSLQLFENGNPLGPAHSLHRDIRSEGRGRFSHWHSNLYFSSSDNSDPRTNGRVYSYTTNGQSQLEVVATNSPGSRPTPPQSSIQQNQENSQPSNEVVNQAEVEGVEYKGVTSAMWNEVNRQAGEFGDNNRCQERLASIPSSGHVIGPCNGNCINEALANHNVVVLRPGTYRISSQINFSDKTLVGLHPTEVVIDASAVDRAITLGSNSTISNLTLIDSRNSGIFMTNNNNVYRVSVYRTGFSAHQNNNGAGIMIYRGSGNCIVSVESSDGYNEDGQGCASCANGGNADGIYSKFQSSNNSFIDTHAYRNSDDGFDFWESTGPMYVYFSSAFRNGVNLAGRETGDGNGFKLGRGSFPVYIYKSHAYNNPSRGFDVNGNTIEPIAISSESTGNRVDWVGISIR